MSVVKIALANLRYPPTPEESIDLARSAIAQAGRENAAVVCFPECYIPGYRAHDTSIVPPSAEFLERAWADIARTAAEAGVAVVLGTERIVDGSARITTLVINADGTRAGFQDK